MSVNPEQKPTEESEVLKWTSVFQKVWPQLRDYGVKFLLLRFLPRFISGPWSWVVIPVSNWIVDHVFKPAWDFGTRKILVLLRKKQNNQAGQDVQNSRTEGEFDSRYDDLP